MQYKTIKLFVLLLLLLASCWQVEPFVPEFPVGEVEGFRPIYASSDKLVIKYGSPQPLQSPGKIYTYQHYLLISDALKGIHVFDNSNPSNPIALGFLQVPGNSDMALKGTTLYVNHLSDLVALQIDDWTNIVELSRIAQDSWSIEVPPGTGRYFECPDQRKGIVVGWELTTLNNPTCFR